MAERMGLRRIDEIEREWPKEAPIIRPTDQPADTTPPNIGDDIGDRQESEMEPLPRLEPMGPGDREAARWNTEADAIEAWAAKVGNPEAYVQDVEARMYEPSDSIGDADDVTPPDIGEDIGGDIDAGISDVEGLDGADQEP